VLGFRKGRRMAMSVKKLKSVHPGEVLMEEFLMPLSI
jgi:hypothetical protein